MTDVICARQSAVDRHIMQVSYFKTLLLCSAHDKNVLTDGNTTRNSDGFLQPGFTKRQNRRAFTSLSFQEEKQSCVEPAVLPNLKLTALSKPLLIFCENIFRMAMEEELAITLITLIILIIKITTLIIKITIIIRIIILIILNLKKKKNNPD